ncbi:MAG: hypothetical protein U1F36_14565 [Planctomycetota bacterium]
MNENPIDLVRSRRRSRGRTLLALSALCIPIGGGMLVSSAAQRAHAVLPTDHPFLVSTQCETCHSNSATATAMRDSANRAVSPFDLWRGTMMANSGRDPYWRAELSAEIATVPSRRSEIEEKCTRCHQPMASTGPGQGDSERHWSPDKIQDGGPRADLALDGVSCTVCHAILPDNLRTQDSFTGGYYIDDQDRIFGPHNVTFTGPMVNFTGKIPVQGNHIRDNAGLCASCHTLFTHTVRPDGVATGHEYPEQVPYLEWRNSIYQDEVSPGPNAVNCQGCHVPTDSVDGVPISTKIARNPIGNDYPTIPARQPFGRHIFVGGNLFVPRMLRDNAAALRVAAPAAAFDATIANVIAQLANRTARVTIPSITRNGADLDVVVHVDNLCGHKYPSAYPSRRAWFRVVVTDANQQVVWRSGDYDPQGRIVGVNGQPLSSELAGGPIQAHKDLVTNPDAPQIYEVVMGDENGAVTHRLLRAAVNVKDDRLLPLGYSSSHPDATHTAPVGTAADPNFTAGADDVTFRVNAPQASGPYHVEVQLLHQPISARWAAELFTVQTPEVAAFQGYWNNTDRTPAVVGSASAQGN